MNVRIICHIYLLSSILTFARNGYKWNTINFNYNVFWFHFSWKTYMTINYDNFKVFLLLGSESFLKFLELDQYIWRRWNVALLLETVHYCLSFLNELKLFLKRNVVFQLSFQTFEEYFKVIAFKEITPLGYIVKKKLNIFTKQREQKENKELYVL